MEGDNANNTNNNANTNANSNQNAQNTTGQNNNNANPASNTIDYNKIQEMIDGRNAKTEDSILKSYFEKQGLSKEEMESAINAFKTQKANQANAQNKELSDAQASLKQKELENQRLKVEKEAYKFVDDLNIDNKTMPYLLKMADLSNCVDKDGKVLDDTLKTALEKVITDIPGLKKQTQGVTGVIVGADTSNNTNSSNNMFDFNFAGVRPKKS